MNHLYIGFTSPSQPNIYVKEYDLNKSNQTLNALEIKFDLI
jgi:hypothetical protein